MRKIKKLVVTLLILLVSLSNFYAQNPLGKANLSRIPANIIHWQKPGILKISETDEAKFLLFQEAQYETGKNNLPFLTLVKKNTESALFSPVLLNIQTETITDAEEISIIKTMEEFISYDFEVNFYTREVRKEKDGIAKIIPVRKTKDGRFEKLLAFDIEWLPAAGEKKPAPVQAQSFATNSVLSSGNWFKVGVTQSGVYKMDYNFLKNAGIDPDSIDPRNIRVYGNGGHLLPESNAVYRADDLNENAIYVPGETDGKFDAGDYVLFYGQGPHQWNRQTSGSCIKFRHKVNIYSDTSYYFITTDLGAGKRIQSDSSSAVSNVSVNSFDDYQFYENNSSNLIKSGREWYGEYFDVLTSYNYNFSFPNIVAGDSVLLEVALANRMGSPDPNAYSVTYPSGSISLTSSICSLTNFTAPYAADGSVCTHFQAGSSPLIGITVTKNNSAALGWLNYVRINARRQLIMAGQQMMFRDTRSVGAGNVGLFSIGGISSKHIIWETTDIFNVKEKKYAQSGSVISFNQVTDSLREFIIFSAGISNRPVFCGKISNQNLHSYTQADLIIISYPDFVNEAQRLAQLHLDLDTFSSVVVTPQQIYNEFSSGSQDIVAIRDFIRMLYKRASSSADAPRFAILLGDGSYRYKSNSISNSNFVPTYQSISSLEPTASYTSDDFYGLLDDTEGDFSNDAVDLGVGRIPAKSSTEANQIVNKIFEYTKKNGIYNTDLSSCSNTEGTPFGDWRNWICFMADDEDNDLHITQADTIAKRVAKKHPSYNINKIYLDAYQEMHTPGGEAYPDVNKELDRQVEKGCLILNYTGHGGEIGLAHEGVLSDPQILGYDNFDRLPLWFTATCEFSRYDDPDRTSAGEYVLLNPKGGGIALFSTVRLTYATSNYNLSLKMWDLMLDSMHNEIPYMGEIFMAGKQATYMDANTRNFTLLGDPALKLSYPQNVVITDSINSVSVSMPTDTLKALSRITIKGHLANAPGTKLSNYNGVIYPVVFDKASSITTLGNDAGSPPLAFQLQKNILYKGKSTVTNGEFSFTFIVPKDIAYNYGVGKISYYSHNGYTDATGYYKKAVVGGSNPNAPVDNAGPRIKLYMNDDKFVSGGTTNENPKIYAELSDSSGINTVGNGIGHDIVATLDDNSNAPIVLNDYYQADLNSYQAGKILYGLEGLSEGTHKLNLKVWDVQNNSNTAYTEFVVAKSANLALNHILNYPNPFSTHTRFFLEHNNCCTELNVSIEVFTVAGKVVKSINRVITNDGYRTEGIDWDGRDEYGDKLARGVYVYKVKIKDQEGKTAEKFEKLVILN